MTYLYVNMRATEMTTEIDAKSQNGWLNYHSSSSENLYGL